jgi:hypothetical protein
MPSRLEPKEVLCSARCNATKFQSLLKQGEPLDPRAANVMYWTRPRRGYIPVMAFGLVANFIVLFDR